MWGRREMRAAVSESLGEVGGGRDWWDQETEAGLEAGGICALLSLWAERSSVLCTGHLLLDHS